MTRATLKHPEWSRDAAIYQINTRQFTSEGTLRAAQGHLPRLRELGVGILWLMPVHEIGRRNRKGSLGSPYSVRDYYSVSSELGTMDDLRSFVRAAHGEGMRVLLDWVANHTAWDCNLVDEHPEWYARDWKGEFRPTPWVDWPDVLDLDYRHPELRSYMIGAMKQWVTEADVDGFRCDVAGFVPADFWEQARAELGAVKPVFMLAEADARDLHAAAFDMTYAWGWYDAMHRLSSGKAGLDELLDYYAVNEKSYPADGMRMTFVSNHDKNAWVGTEFEQFGAGLEASMVLSVVGEGMPLIYNGQEAGNPRRLSFFERDPIGWRPHPLGELYRKLLALKKANTALWNAGWGARMIRVPNSSPEVVLSFVRRNERDRVFAAFNFSGESRAVTFDGSLCHGAYRDAFGGEPVEVSAATRLELAPWGHRVLTG
jgi:glycosidase